MRRFNYTFEDIKTLFRNECCKGCKKNILKGVLIANKLNRRKTK